jgi:hypothetical protein
MITIPFNFSKLVIGKNFYNRVSEIKKAIEYIKGNQCFSIIGEKRIGITSFLFYLLSKNVMKEYELNPNEYIPIYLNVSKFRRSEEDLLNDIINRLKDYVLIEINLDETLIEKEELRKLFEKYVDHLSSLNKVIILAFDEFEVAIESYDDSFQYWLRVILQEKEGIMAIITTHKFSRLDKTSNRASSLLNIFVNLHLGLFSEEESRKMIIDLFKKGGMELDKEEISQLYRLSGGNPCLIQLIGMHYYKEKKSNKKIVFKKFKNNMLVETEQQFESYWNNLNRNEHIYLINLVSNNIKSNDYIKNILQKRGFLDNDAVFSDLFAEFIKTKIESKKPKKEGIIVKIRKIFSKKVLKYIIFSFIAALALIIYFYFNESIYVSLIPVVVGALLTVLFEHLLKS